MRAPVPPQQAEVVVGGVVAGLAGGLVMIVALAVLPGAPGLLDTARGIAAAWMGLPALLGGPSVVALGLATHLGVAAVWGLVYAAFVRGDADGIVATAIGLVWGAASWLIMVWGVLPAFDPVLYPRVALDPWPWLVAHLLFGATLGVSPAVQRAVAFRLRARRPKPVLVLHTFRRR